MAAIKEDMAESLESRNQTVSPGEIDIEKPRWDQHTYSGRFKHFFTTTNPLNVFASNEELENAKKVVEDYRAGVVRPGLTKDDLWAAKHLYDSAYHPDTGEKNFLLGRMSFQVPGNMLITGCMMTFYRSTPAVVFWQWVNQTFNCVVNYTNRNATAGATNEQLMTAYGAASTASVLTAVGLNKLVARNKALHRGIVGRLVPLVAVAAANCVNIPLMRQRELANGIDVYTEKGEVMGASKAAAKEALFQVIPSRILMATPGMTIPPLIMSKLENGALLRSRPWLSAPITVLMTGACLVFSTPACCALFPQESKISVDKLEPKVQTQLRKRFGASGGPDALFYNKGL